MLYGQMATEGEKPGLVAAAIVIPKWGDRVENNCENPSDRISHRRNPVNKFEQLRVEALRKCFESLEETMGRLNEVTVQAPRGSHLDPGSCAQSAENFYFTDLTPPNSGGVVDLVD